MMVSALHSPSFSQSMLDQVRQDTPACQTILHLNNAGAALPPQCVVDAVTEHLTLEAAIGGYEAAAQQAQQVTHTTNTIAHLLHCQPEEVALVENATRAWDMAFYSFKFKPGDRILTAQAEYASNYIAYLHVAQKAGAMVEVVPDDEHGQLDVAALANLIDDRVKLITLTHLPTNNGLINPAAEVGQLAKSAGIPFLLDACQSAGQLPLDVETLGCDMLSATGRKYLRGPRGTGFLYVRQSLIEQLDPPFLDLHAATWTSPTTYTVDPTARRFENWESYVAGRIGLGVAVDYALGLGLDAIHQRVTHLAQTLRGYLSETPGVTVQDTGVQHSGIVTFSLAKGDHDGIAQALRQQKINVSVSPKQYTLLDMTHRQLDSVIRASVHYYNTEAELTRFVETLSKLI